MYALFDYGNFVEDTSSDLGNPFIQLLPTTNLTAAHEAFVQVRLSGVDTTGSSSQWLLPSSEMQHSPETEAEKKAQYVSHFPSPVCPLPFPTPSATCPPHPAQLTPASPGTKSTCSAAGPRSSSAASRSC